LQQQIEQQVLLDLIPAMVWYKDSHNRILRANRRAADSIKKTVTEIEGRLTDEFYPEEAERYHQDDLEVIVSGRPKLGIIEPYQTGDGEKRWVQTDKVPYLDPQGKVLGVLVFAQDITDRKQTEEALRESADCLRVVMESASNGIIIADAGGKILSANTQVEAQFGYERGELLGHAVERLMPARLRPPGSDRAGVFLIGPDDRSVSPVCECVGLRKDGTEFPFTMTALSVADGERNPYGSGHPPGTRDRMNLRLVLTVGALCFIALLLVIGIRTAIRWLKIHYPQRANAVLSGVSLFLAGVGVLIAVEMKDRPAFRPNDLLTLQEPVVARTIVSDRESRSMTCVVDRP
jgi:PAS domain S-box-containing protein